MQKQLISDASSESDSDEMFRTRPKKVKKPKKNRFKLTLEDV